MLAPAQPTLNIISISRILIQSRLKNRDKSAQAPVLLSHFPAQSQ
jgi:hypothetical protein